MARLSPAGWGCQSGGAFPQFRGHAQLQALCLARVPCRLLFYGMARCSAVIADVKYRVLKIVGLVPMAIRRPGFLGLGFGAVAPRSL